jgi:hypothetical protein
MRCVMDGSSFTILDETPCADPHAGCCGGWGLNTLGYPISTFHLLAAKRVANPTNIMPSKPST